MINEEVNNILDTVILRRNPKTFDDFEKRFHDSYKIIVYRSVNRVNNYDESVELLRCVKSFCRSCDNIISQEIGVKRENTFENVYVRFFRMYTNIWHEYNNYYGLKKLFFRFTLYCSYNYILMLLNEIIEMKTYSKIMYKYSLLKEKNKYNGD